MDGRAKLAAAAIRRRLELGRTEAEVAKLAGMTPKTYIQVEKGRNVLLLTVWKLDEGLDWEQGSAWRIFTDDGEPIPKPPTDETESSWTMAEDDQ